MATMAAAIGIDYGSCLFTPFELIGTLAADHSIQMLAECAHGLRWSIN